MLQNTESVPEMYSLELAQWVGSKNVVGIYGGNSSGKNRICLDLYQHLSQTGNRSSADVCYISPKLASVTTEEFFSVEWRNSFFEDAMMQLKSIPQIVIVDDIWPFLDEDQTLMIWSMLATVAGEQGVTFVADSYLERLRPWCDVLYEVDLGEHGLWRLPCEPENVPQRIVRRFNKYLRQIVKNG